MTRCECTMCEEHENDEYQRCPNEAKYHIVFTREFSFEAPEPLNDAYFCEGCCERAWDMIKTKRELP